MRLLCARNLFRLATAAAASSASSPASSDDLSKQADLLNECHMHLRYAIGVGDHAEAIDAAVEAAKEAANIEAKLQKREDAERILMAAKQNGGAAAGEKGPAYSSGQKGGFSKEARSHQHPRACRCICWTMQCVGSGPRGATRRRRRRCHPGAACF